VESDDPVEAIGDLCDREGSDLVLAPSSDRLGFQQFISPSFRAKLLKRCKAPVWTAGNCLDRFNFKPSIQSVACVLDFDCPNDTHLRLAASLAWHVGATMRIVTVLAPTDEGTLARCLYSRGPLMPEVAVSRIRSAFAGRVCPEIEVAVGEPSTELPRLLKRCDADLAFVGPGQALGGVWRPRLEGFLDRLPCPVICVDGASASFEGWNFNQHGFDMNDVHSGLLRRGEAIAS
jgi:nucleotide-binding universal stress UspA family protein